MILKQGESTNFINADAKKKYTYFLRATGLEELDRRLDVCDKTVKDTSAEIQRVKALLDKRIGDVKGIEGDINRLRDMEEEHKQREEQLRVQLQWVAVNTCIQQVEEIKGRIGQIKTETAQCDGVLVTTRANESQAKGRQRGCADKINMLQDKLDNFKGE